MKKYTENELDNLRSSVFARLSEKRYLHTVAVEECAQLLGGLLMPEAVSQLRAAALLHDISKELPYDEQISLLRASGFSFAEADMSTKGILHSFSAPIVIKRDFPDFALDVILAAVESHTVGSENMSIFDMIIFISDYVEHTRPYQSCITLRKYLLDGLSELSYQERTVKLIKACLIAINNTEKALLGRKDTVNPRMLKAKDYLQRQILQN